MDEQILNEEAAGGIIVRGEQTLLELAQNLSSSPKIIGSSRLGEAVH